MLFEQVWDEAESLEHAVDITEPPLLTATQQRVLGLVAEGRTDHYIAQRLSTSERSVRRHVTEVLSRLGVPSRPAAVYRAMREGILG